MTARSRRPTILMAKTSAPPETINAATSAGAAGPGNRSMGTPEIGLESDSRIASCNGVSIVPAQRMPKAPPPVPLMDSTAGAEAASSRSPPAQVGVAVREFACNCGSEAARPPLHVLSRRTDQSLRLSSRLDSGVGRRRRGTRLIHESVGDCIRAGILGEPGRRLRPCAPTAGAGQGAYRAANRTTEWTHRGSPAEPAISRTPVALNPDFGSGRDAVNSLMTWERVSGTRPN